jgi:uncharacterized protein with ATP-grasp and redox domains
MPNLNPTIREVEIGIRELRKLEILPLSIKSQLDTTTILVELVDIIINQGVSSAENANKLLELVTSNIFKILSIATENEEPYKLIEEITNKQAIEIAEIIYSENYEDVLKKVKSLTQTVQTINQEMGPST